MDYITPADVPLPAFLDPLLAYLSNKLPPSVYSFLLSFLSHFLTLVTALYSLTRSLLSTQPWNWDAQTILPPLISLLGAYLALLSLYRTTSWMMRTSFWFIKWGTIIGALVAGAGWFMGTGNGIGKSGIVAGLGSLVLDMINGQGQNAAGGSRRSGRSRSTTPESSQSKRKPRAWDSFQAHRDWQYQENEGGGNEGAQDIIGGIVNAAGQALRESGWWDIAKGVIDGAGDRDAGDQDRQRRKQPDRKAKTKAGKSSSR